MIRIGIVGSDNSHADRYSELLNRKDMPKDRQVRGAKVTHLFGIPEHRQRTEEVAKNNHIPNVVERVEDMIGEVDAVMTVFRDGALHAPYTLPLLAAGIPAYVDKPYTRSVADAKSLIAVAKRKKVLLTNYSTLRIALRNHQKEIDACGEITSMMCAGPGSLKADYGGLIFYGCHATEMAITLGGADVTAVTARQSQGEVLATFRWAKGPVASVHFLEKARYAFAVSVFGTQGCFATSNVESGNAYVLGLKAFLRAVESGEPVYPMEMSVTMVKCHLAIEQSLKSGAEVKLSEVK
ncbi:MAG: Gfo/Idh/MocA family oxidoreductase [Armatimonadetes bacterium]|nr:Gfo/Idh/MocA family oxidoreductase [Armatimonadota bacterium]